MWKNNIYLSKSSPCQISSNSMERLQRYGDLRVFSMAAIGHFGLLKFNFFSGLDGEDTLFASSCQISWRSVKPLLRYHDFCDFQHGDRCRLGLFQKFKILMASPLQGADLCHYAIFLQNRWNGWTVAEIWRFNGFQYGGHPPSWIFEIQFF